jgi:hypothetical protein
MSSSEEIRYYRSQVFTADDEMTPEQARSASGFVRAFAIDGKVVRAEIVSAPDKIDYVAYYEVAPSENLIRQHRERYGARPFHISPPRRQENEYVVAETYEYNAHGELIEREQTYLDAKKWPRLQRRLAPNGDLLETVEYEYEADGNLAIVRTRAADGTVLHEDRAPLLD